MTTTEATPLVPSHARFEHAVVPYADLAELVSALQRHVHPGIDRGDAVVVVAPTAHTEALRTALGGHASAVEVHDVCAVGRNPGRLIPFWAAAAQRAAAAGRRLLGVSEPWFSGRVADEAAECLQHERLLNIAFEGSSPVSLLCPIDVTAADPSLAEAMCAAHPAMVRTTGSTTAALAADERTHDDWATGALAGPALQEPDAAAVVVERSFGAADIRRVRRAVVDALRGLPLPADRVGDLELAISEVATNSVLYGAAASPSSRQVSRLRVWLQPRPAGGQRVVCEVRDGGRITDPLAGRRLPAPGALGGYGLWLANSVCDLVQLRSSDTGTTVRLHIEAVPRR